MSVSAPIVAAVLSPFFGSFVGTVAIRLPNGRAFFSGRSCCDQCGIQLNSRELVPIVSWLLLKGRCRSCANPINFLHPAAELGALLLAFWAAVTVPVAVLWPSLLFGWALLAISLIDFTHQMIPHVLSAFLAGAGLFVAAIWNLSSIEDHLLGSLLGFVSLWLIGMAYAVVRRRPGLGGGDPWLFAAIGAWVSWQGLPSILFYASQSGLAHAAVLVILGRKVSRATRLPFGPHLALGGWLVWLYGPLALG